MTTPWLRFKVSDRDFALPLRSVAEVANAAAPRLIPLVPRSLGGVATFRGEPLPVLDAPALLGAEPGGRRRHLVVLADAHLRLGLLVGEVVRIERNLDEAAELDEPRGPEFVDWVWLEGEIGLIRPEELLERATTLLTEQRIEGGTMPWHDAF
jgi:chemotaxis signal transduction protein